MSCVRLNPTASIGSITFASGWSKYADYDKNLVIEENGIVNCSIRCKPTQTVSSGGWKTVGTISPANTGVYTMIYSIAIAYINNAYVAIEARISNGTLEIYPAVNLPSGAECVFNFTYTTD